VDQGRKRGWQHPAGLPLPYGPNAHLASANLARPSILIVGRLVPLDGIDLNTLFDELAAIEDQLKPYKYELEELGL
jgi:hypothetical protein